jgi:hypothetical protein
MASIDAVPSITSPQLMSMSSSCFCHRAVFVLSFSDGDGAQP